MLDYGELKIKFDTVCMQNEDLIAALNYVEWVPSPWSSLYICPWCGSLREDGHRSDCQRQKALQIKVYYVNA